MRVRARVAVGACEVLPQSTELRALSVALSTSQRTGPRDSHGVVRDGILQDTSSTTPYGTVSGHRRSTRRVREKVTVTVRVVLVVHVRP